MTSSLTTEAVDIERHAMIGRTLAGRYTITGVVGSGGMGDVYRAVQLAVGREVAVKIVSRVRSGSEFQARFMREARANSLLASPHSVRLLDFGQSEEGELFLVMELLEGESLRQRLTRVGGRLSPSDALAVCRQALRSLAEAHAKGVVHRDLKPDHFFFARMGDSEILKVLDFGGAKMLGEEGRRYNALETQDGHVLGTPKYMSPEQAQGKASDARSDLYSLGVVLYEMLTGAPPFAGESALVTLAQHIAKTPSAPSAACPEAGISAALDRLVLRALAKEPADRPASAEAMAEEIAQVPECPQSTARTGMRKVVVAGTSRRGGRRGIVYAFIGALVIGGGVGAYVFWPRAPAPASNPVGLAPPDPPLKTELRSADPAPASAPVIESAVPIDALPVAPSASASAKTKAKPVVQKPGAKRSDFGYLE